MVTKKKKTLHRIKIFRQNTYATCIGSVGSLCTGWDRCTIGSSWDRAGSCGGIGCNFNCTCSWAGEWGCCGCSCGCDCDCGFICDCVCKSDCNFKCNCDNDLDSNSFLESWHSGEDTFAEPLKASVKSNCLANFLDAESEFCSPCSTFFFQ